MRTLLVLFVVATGLGIWIGWVSPRLAFHPVLRQVWRLIILIIGGTTLLLGLIMIVTPGPAMVFVPLGLSILAIEFVWARRLLKRVRSTITSRKQDSSDDAVEPPPDRPPLPPARENP